MSWIPSKFWLSYIHCPNFFCLTLYSLYAKIYSAPRYFKGHDQLLLLPHEEKRIIQLTSGGLLKRKFLFKALISVTSSTLRSKLLQSRFSIRRCGFEDFGMTARPRWVAHRRRTWAGVLLYFCASPATMGWSKSLGVSVAFFHSSSMKDRGPNLNENERV